MKCNISRKKIFTFRWFRLSIFIRKMTRRFKLEESYDVNKKNKVDFEITCDKCSNNIVILLLYVSPVILRHLFETFFVKCLRKEIVEWEH